MIDKGAPLVRDVDCLDMIYPLRRAPLYWVRAIDWLYVSQQLS